MKITKLTKLLISFMGGGKIDFPTRNLREVEIDGDGAEGGGGNDSLVDSAVSTYNEKKNRVLDKDIIDLEEYNLNFKEYITEEYGNGDNVFVFRTHDNEEIAFKFTDDELTEFMYKIAIFNDWRNDFISFPISHIIVINNDGTQFITTYNINSFGKFGGAILGYQNSINLGLTGKENFIKLNSIDEISNIYLYNDDWISERTQQFSLNDYNFKQVFDSTFDIYKLKSGNTGDMEFGLIKIVNKEDNNQTMFTTYSIYNGPGK